MTKEAKLTGLELLRAPFPAHQISKLPKPTAQQTKDVKNDYKAGIRCEICKAWHHPKVVHLDYVGHAALTDRLLDSDPAWDWNPLALTDAGLPAFDATGGLWITLTVCGVTRKGYGHAAQKDYGDPGAREKEVIGDALRNAAMRFGAALDLWHKGDLHIDDDAEPESPKPKATPKAEPKAAPVDHAKLLERLKAAINKQATTEALAAWWNTPSVEAARASLSEEVRHELTAEYDAKFNALNKPIIADEIPYK